MEVRCCNPRPAEGTRGADAPVPLCPQHLHEPVRDQILPEVEAGELLMPGEGQLPQCRGGKGDSLSDPYGALTV
jgi:hypothetical protein